jgi:hypothetical protein
MNSSKVKVRALDDGAGGVDFEVDGVKAKKARLKLEKDTGPHAIDFELHDQSGRALTFHSEDPIWVGENCECPPPAGINTDQLSVIGCNTDTLSVTNQNSGDPREIRYLLHFVANDGSKHECDPVIQNGGGIKPG